MPPATVALEVGKKYTVVSFTFGRLTDYNHPELTLRDDQTGQRFTVRPTMEGDIGADGGWYQYEGLACTPVIQP